MVHCVIMYLEKNLNTGVKCEKQTVQHLVPVAACLILSDSHHGRRTVIHPSLQHGCSHSGVIVMQRWPDIKLYFN